MFTTAIALIALVGTDHTAAAALTGLMILASGLESIFAICLGGEVFALLIRVGVVPQSVCADCADISRLRRAQPAPDGSGRARAAGPLRPREPGGADQRQHARDPEVQAHPPQVVGGVDPLGLLEDAVAAVAGRRRARRGRAGGSARRARARSGSRRAAGRRSARRGTSARRSSTAR